MPRTKSQSAGPEPSRQLVQPIYCQANEKWQENEWWNKHEDFLLFGASSALVPDGQCSTDRTVP